MLSLVMEEDQDEGDDDFDGKSVINIVDDVILIGISMSKTKRISMMLLIARIVTMLRTIMMTLPC